MSIWIDIQRRVGAAATGTPDGVTAAAIAGALGIVTINCAAELIGHEAIVQEAYRDSKGVWTWGIGVTNASGHLVHPRYKDNPQPIARCLEIFLWLLEEKYAPAVRAAFAGHAISEAQFAAALSFHYNTGAIGTADWVNLWKAGKVDAARSAIMNWRKPPEIVPRREKERDLFFDGTWSNDGTAMVYPVAKPSYAPAFSKGTRMPILDALRQAMGGAS